MEKRLRPLFLCQIVSLVNALNGSVLLIGHLKLFSKFHSDDVKFFRFSMENPPQG